MPISQNRESGGMVVELFVVAGVLLLLFYGSMMVNYEIDQRHMMQIAVRNIGSTVEHSEKIKSLKRDFDLQALTKFMNRADAIIDSGKVRVGRSEFRIIEPGALRKHRILADIATPGTWYDRMSAVQGRVGQASLEIIDRVKNFEVFGKSLLIPDRPYEALLQVDGTSAQGWWHDSFESVADVVTGEGEREKQRTMRTYGLSRSSSGYHPNEYRYEAVLGYFLGLHSDLKHWHSPSERGGFSIETDGSLFSRQIGEGFLKECMNHFVANSDCQHWPGNWMALTIKLIGHVKGILQAIADLVSGGGAEGMNELAKEGYNQISDAMVDALVDKVEGKLKEAASRKVESLKNRKIDDVVKPNLDRIGSKVKKVYDEAAEE